MPRSGCTHSRNEKTNKCRSKIEHERLLSGKKKRSCKYSLSKETGLCKTKRQHEKDVLLFRSKRAFKSIDRNISAAIRKKRAQSPYDTYDSFNGRRRRRR